MVHNSSEINPSADWPAPIADADLATRALRVLCPTGPVNIVWIDPATGTVGGVTRPTIDDHIRSAIVDRIDTHNLYFTPNTPRADAPDGKLRKSDIAEARAVFADLDPVPGRPEAAERQRLHDIVNAEIASPTPPAFAIDSGNGCQLIWRTPPTADFARAEALGRGIALKLGSDPVQNVDRILRIPYTNNLPTARKRAAGRVTRPTGLLRHTAAIHDLPTLERRFPPAAHAPGNSAAVAHHDVDWHAAAEPIDPALAARFAELADNDAVLRAIIAGTHHHTGDRSRMDYALVGRLVDHGLEPQAIATALMHFKHGKMPELLHDDPPEAQRQFDRALARSPHTIPAAAEFEPIPGFDPGKPPSNDNTSPSIFDITPTTRAPLAYERFDDIDLSTDNEPLIEDILDCGDLSVWYGQSGVGKTHNALDAAFHTALGLPWHEKPTRQGAVLYVIAEGGVAFGRRILALRQRYAEQIAAFGRPVPIAVIRHPVDLFDPNADTNPLIAIARQVEADFSTPLRLIFLDTLARVMAGGDENSGQDMGLLVRHVDRIRHSTAAHVGLIHHSGKDQAKGARGHSSLRAAVDTEIEIEREAFVTTKQRNMEQNIVFRWRQEIVTLGEGRNGRPITAAVAVAVETPAGAEFSEEMEAAAAAERAARERAAAIEAQTVGEAVLRAMGDLYNEITVPAAIPAVRAVLNDLRGGEHGDRSVRDCINLVFRPALVVEIDGRLMRVALRRTEPGNPKSTGLLVREPVSDEDVEAYLG